MSWRMPRRRKYDREDNDEDDDFDMFGFDFRSGFEHIDEMIEGMFRTAKDLMKEGPKANPIYYGYSVTIGPDGKPNVREFGNVKPTRRGTFELGSREPFVDTVVDEKEGKLKVVAEMPGIERQDIKLEANEDSLTIRAEHGERKYETTVPFKVEVEPSSATATYNNGVLEVKMKLKAAQKPKGVNIKIE